MALVSLSRAAALLAVALLALPLAGCGCCDEDYRGNVFVANHTDTTTNEDVNTFELAAFGQPFSGNLLSAPLLPGDARQAGAFPEDYYDATSQLSLGQMVDWFDVFVPAHSDTFFDAF